MSNEEKKTGDTTMVTTSATSIIAEENSAGDAVVAIVPESMKSAPGAPATAEIGPFFGKGKNRIKLTVAANARLLEEIIYNYWDDHGQFGNNNLRKTGPDSSLAYKGAKEYKSYATPHEEDRNKRKNILLDGVEEFGKIFQKYEMFPIWDLKAT